MGEKASVARRSAAMGTLSHPLGATIEGLRALSVEVYGPDIPPALLLAAEATVDTPYACLAYVRAFRPEVIPQLQHAVLRRHGQLVGILSFYRRRRRLVVVNRLVRL